MSIGGNTRFPKDYRWPAEWEPQAAIWFAWPSREDLWSGAIEMVREQLAQLYLLAAHFQAVHVLCPQDLQADCRARLQSSQVADNIHFFDYQTDDVWCRDFLPIFLQHRSESKLRLCDWRFNAWGKKFEAYQRDDTCGQWLAQQLKLERCASSFILEGGAVESNGAGLVLSTDPVLYNANRNTGWSREAIDQFLLQSLSAQKLCSLPKGLYNDDTDGHVDNVARFCAADRLLLAQEGNPLGRNHQRLQENFERAADFKTLDGREIERLSLPLPDPIFHQSEQLPASYLNFIFLNGAVIVPTFSQPGNDQAALERFQVYFPDRAVHGFDCSLLLREGGALHCLSQHQPACVVEHDA
jgi:agmatine deiminase